MRSGLNLNLRRLRFAIVAPLLATAAVAAVPAGASAATGSTVTGTVSVPAGVNAHHVHALLLDTAGSEVASATVVAGSPTTTGTYTFDNVPTGTYKIYYVDSAADDVAPVYEGGSSSFAGASTITVSGDYTVSAVTLGSGGEIAGTVTDPNTGASSYFVAACLVGTPDPGQSAYLGATSGGQLCSTGTVTGGTYSINGLVPGDSYQITYGFRNTTQNWADSVYVEGSGVTLDPGSASNFIPVSGSALTANFTLPTVGSISGVVTDPGGVADTSLTIDLYDGAGTEQTESPTFSDGTYTVNGVLPGSYKVGFIPDSALIAPQYYNDSATLASATVVTVSSGANAAAINATLTSAATVSGTVTTAQGGADLGGLEVEALDANGSVVDATFTNANGTYTLTGLPAGTWYLRFDGGQAYNGSYYTTEYYGGSATLAGSVPVVLTAGEALIDANQALLAESTVRPGVPTVSAGRLSGLYKDKVALSFKLTAGSGTAGYLESFRIKLPKNVSWNKKNIGRYLVIAHDTYKYAIKSGQLVVTFASGKKTVSLRLKAGGITVSKGIENLAKERKIASEAIDVSATDTTGLTTSLSFMVKRPH